MKKTPHFENGEALSIDKQKTDIKHCPVCIKAGRLFNNHSRSETQD